jgi:sugar transferase (PEP-CTERM system associated)
MCPARPAPLLRRPTNDAVRLLMSVRFLGVIWNAPLLLLASCVGFSLWAATYGVAAVFKGGEFLMRPQVAQYAGVFTLSALLVVGALGVFSRRQRAGVTGLTMRTLFGVLLGSIPAFLTVRIAGDWTIEGRLIAAITVVGAIAACTVVAVVSRTITEEVFRRRIIVYGSGVRALSIAALRRRTDTRGFRLLGYVQPQDEPVAVPADKLISSANGLLDLVQKGEVDEIVVAMDDRRRNFPLGELLDCRLAGIEGETGKVYLEVLNPSWLIFGAGFRRDWLRRLSERSFDVIASLIVLGISSPIMLLTALLIKLEDGWRAPIFYKQARVGFRGRNFGVVKFRSMRTDAEKNGAVWAQKGDSRVTRVGSVIRRLRIDELPQVINVLRGDMSFVGPRPERPEFVDQLAEKIPYYHERHWVKPGITGWAQLCYPYGASDHDAVEKLQFDLYYVKNHSLLFDLMILIQTAEVVLLGKGVR